MPLKFFRAKAQSAEPPPITVISVGRPFPEECPPSDCVALAVDGSGLSYRMWLSAPVDSEAADLAGNCVACGFYSLPECGGGFPLFIFEGSNGQWLIKAPLVSPGRLVEEWINGRTGNAVVFYLMERPSGVVRKIRTLGLSEDFMELLAEHWGRSAHPGDGQAYVRLAASVDDAEIWERSMKWAFDKENDTFRRIRDR